MKQILILQILVLTAVALISAAFSGLTGFWSAVAGGFSYLVPFAFAVVLLKLFKRNPLYHGKAFIIGEVLKVVLSLVMMLVVLMVWYQSLIFFPFLFGLFGVSHFVFLVLLRVLVRPSTNTTKVKKTAQSCCRTVCSSRACTRRMWGIKLPGRASWRRITIEDRKSVV